MSANARDERAVALPSWAVVGDKRREHIVRVTTLLDQWAAALGIDATESRAWHDAGRYHDALRDAPEAVLREITGDRDRPVGLLHGPAAAVRLQSEGNPPSSVLEAVRWHTTGNAQWERTGRALYLADFLEPGRRFLGAERDFLAAHVVHDFDGVFRQVVRLRIDWTVSQGGMLYPETVALWNSIR